MIIRSKLLVSAIFVVAAFALLGILARFTAAQEARSDQPQHAPGPSGPYSRADLTAAHPFDDAMRVKVAQALKGSVDLHMHTDPDIAPRPVDSIDVVKMAQSYGLRAIVLKNHYEPTVGQVYILRKLFPGVEIFGGITMDLTNGGVNPAAVEHFARMKGGFGKVVWFPTYDSEASLAGRSAIDVIQSKQPKPFARVSVNGQLTPESKEVISLTAKYNLLLETGHVSPEEGLLIIREGVAQHVQHMMVTHAMDDKWNIPQMQQAAKMGAFIEFAKPAVSTSVAEYSKGIRAVGPNSCVVDETGVSFLPPELVGAFVAGLFEQGFTTSEIDRMMKINPAQLLGLPPQ